MSWCSYSFSAPARWQLGRLWTGAAQLAKCWVLLAFDTLAIAALLRFVTFCCNCTAPAAESSAHSGGSSGWQELVVDPGFAAAFTLARPTPRYAIVQSALPAVLVAPPRRLLQALLILGGERV